MHKSEQKSIHVNRFDVEEAFFISLQDNAEPKNIKVLSCAASGKWKKVIEEEIESTRTLDDFPEKCKPIGTNGFSK